jgi:hypothetical protein
VTTPLHAAIGRSIRCPRCGGMATASPAQAGRDPADVHDPRLWESTPAGPRPKPPEWVMLRCGGSCVPKLYDGSMSVEVVP